MTLFRRYKLFLGVLPVVVAIALLKMAVHQLGFEFLAIDGLIPSIVAGATFIIGFLLSHVLSDYKEAERLISDMRVALEAIHGDAQYFAEGTPDLDLAPLRAALLAFLAEFEACLTARRTAEGLSPALAKAEALVPLFLTLERASMPERYIVRLRAAQDSLRRALYRITYMQTMQFLPSVHVLVQTLVACCLFLMLFLKTSAPLEAALLIGFASYLFVYALFLIAHLEKPFRKGVHSVDDVSLFLLRDFAQKLRSA